jgi:hypothetical protein
MSFATTHETSAMNLAVLGGQLFARLCELTRLNMDTSRLVFSGVGLLWESVLQAQTPDQLVRHQADALPRLATLNAGYTRGWMDIASKVSANLGRSACHRQDEHARHLSTTLDGMARCARGVDAMLRALNWAPVDVDGVPVTGPLADSQEIARADLDRASEITPTVTRRRSPSPKRRQSSR